MIWPIVMDYVAVCLSQLSNELREYGGKLCFN